MSNDNNARDMPGKIAHAFATSDAFTVNIGTVDGATYHGVTPCDVLVDCLEVELDEKTRRLFRWNQIVWLEIHHL